MQGPRLIRVPVLTNTPQRQRFSTFRPGVDVDPGREYDLLRANGVEQVLRDLSPFPLNPWARRHVLLAGIDPWRALRVLLLDRRADAVLCIFESTALLLVLLRRLLRFRPPIVLMEVSPKGWRLRDRILDYVVPRVDQVFALTAAQADYVARTWTLRRPPAVVDWVIDEAFFHPAPPAHGGYVLAVGKDFSRDYTTLLAACERLDCEVVIKTTLEVAVPDSMKGRVRMIRETISAQALRALYAGAAVVAVPMVPTDNPGGISTLLEAMAMARPIVASRTGTVESLVTDGETAVVVPPGDASALGTAIAALIADPERAARLGAAGRATVERRHAAPVRNALLAVRLRALAGAEPLQAEGARAS